MANNKNEYRDLSEMMRQLVHDSGYKKMADAARIASESYNKIVPPQLTQSLRAISEAQKIVIGSSALEIAKSLNKQSKWHDQLLEHTKVMSQLDLTPLQIASASWAKGLSRSVEQLQVTGLLAHRKALSLRLLEPLRLQTEFAKKTTLAIERACDLDTKAALQASMSASQGEIEKWADSIVPVLTLPSDRARPHALRNSDLLDTMQDELLARESIFDVTDATALAASTPSTQASELARQILRKASLSNRASSFSVGQDIFKPTTRLLEVYSDLPMIVASDLSSFGDFMDYVYILLYEAAGKDNLRYHEQNGGMLTDSECSIVWHIKTLRNKWLRHDADHGDANSINRSRNRLSQTLEALGLRHFPNTSQDFRYLQVKIMTEVNQFLDRICQVRS